MAVTILESLKCKLPEGPLPKEFDADSIFAKFQDALPNVDESSLTSDALWRDMLALSGSFHTYYGADEVVNNWSALRRNGEPKNFQYLGKNRAVRLGESNWIEAGFSFEINEAPARICKATLALVPAEDGQWKIWTLRTWIDQLKDHPSVDKLAPPPRLSKRNTKGDRPDSENDDNFECVVIGAGQAGLSVAGRLQSQGIKYVLIEKNAAVGDSWKNRYKSTKLHTTRESSHLPFDRTFPPHFPQYLTKDDLAQGYSEWAEKFGINVWLSTSLVQGQWHDDQQNWILDILKGGEIEHIKTTYLVMAVGAGCQIPTMPIYPGADKFRGTILHSGQYTSAEGWRGKRGIVVGTANTAHDVAEDMLAAGMESVTMIQRSPTYVLPAEYYTRVQNVTYNPETPTDKADMMGLTTPLAVSRLLSMHVLHSMARAEPERFDALEKAGFKTIRYGDIIYQVMDRFGGHYMDVGASAKIAKGLIKVKSDALPLEYTQDGLRFRDGTEIKADLVVFATGFVGSMKVAIRDMLGSDVAERIEDFWGINEEGEIKGAFKPSGHPHLWMHGGTCIHARYMSRYIALQVRVALDGTPLPRAPKVTIARNDQGGLSSR